MVAVCLMHKVIKQALILDLAWSRLVPDRDRVIFLGPGNPSVDPHQWGFKRHIPCQNFIKF